MKWSEILHGTAALTGVLGGLALISAWLAGDTGRVLGFNQVHLYTDATNLFLASIASNVGTLVHQNLERK